MKREEGTGDSIGERGREWRRRGLGEEELESAPQCFEPQRVVGKRPLHFPTNDSMWVFHCRVTTIHRSDLNKITLQFAAKLT